MDAIITMLPTSKIVAAALFDWEGGIPEQLKLGTVAEIFRVGKLGAGHAMKALNNFVAAAAMTTSCEVLVAGQRFRPGPNTMVDILNASTGRSFVTSHVLSEHVVNKRHATGFGLALYARTSA